MKKYIISSVIILTALFTGCTQEQQNKISRSVQNITGINGVVDVYSGGKLVQRWLKVDKLTTGYTSDNKIKPYQFGYGYLDKNFNYKVDPDEKKKLYFQITTFSTMIFYENPLKD